MLQETDELRMCRVYGRGRVVSVKVSDHHGVVRCIHDRHGVVCRISATVHSFVHAITNDIDGDDTRDTTRMHQECHDKCC